MQRDPDDRFPETSRRFVVLSALASPGLTVFFFLLTAACVLAVKADIATPTGAMLLPFGVLVLNLGAAIASHRRFRADLPLLLFHLALLALVILFVLGRLTYLHGAVALTRDTVFSGRLDFEERGPFHLKTYDQLRFVHGGLRQRFVDASGKYPESVSTLRWQDGQRQWHQVELPDGYPLILGRYRIYPSSRRGFSPVFSWQPATGPAELGTVQLLGPADKSMENSSEWLMPNGASAWLKLEKLSPAQTVAGEIRTNLGASNLPHRLIMRIGEQRHELSIGDSVDVPGGRLQYLRLESWMRYTLIHDSTESWLIATVLVAIGSLSWFYLRRFRKQPFAAEEQ